MKKDRKRIIRFFKLLMLIIVTTFTTAYVLDNSVFDYKPTEVTPRKDKDIENPDEDYGGIGVFSYDGDDQTI